MARRARSGSARRGGAQDGRAGQDLALADTLRAGVRVEVTRPHIRFHGGPHDSLHRWPDYTAFIVPTLRPWERQAIFELWVRTLETQRAVPLWAEPATPAPDLPTPSAGPTLGS